MYKPTKKKFRIIEKSYTDYLLEKIKMYYIQECSASHLFWGENWKYVTRQLWTSQGYVRDKISYDNYEQAKKVLNLLQDGLEIDKVITKVIGE